MFLLCNHTWISLEISFSVCICCMYTYVYIYMCVRASLSVIYFFLTTKPLVSVCGLVSLCVDSGSVCMFNFYVVGFYVGLDIKKQKFEKRRMLQK